MYSFSSNLLLTSILLVILKGIHSNQSFIIEKGEWHVVDKGWPIKDKDDVNPHQFYYKKGFGIGPDLSPILVLNQTLVESIKDNLIQPLKLKFKYYQYMEKDERNREFLSYIYSNHSNRQQTDQIYASKYNNSWMPIEFMIPKENFQNFKMTMSSMESMTAIKDLELEYISHDDQLISQNLNNLKSFGWEKYFIPPKVEAKEGSTDYIYFPDCLMGCKMMINMKLLKGFEDNKLLSFLITFRYWTKNSTKIKVFGKDIKPTGDDKWELGNTSFSKLEIYKSASDQNFSIEISTGEDSYFAIKDVQIEYSSEGMSGNSQIEGCEHNSCYWRVSGNYFWSDSNAQKWSSNENNRYLYYPIGTNNLLIVNDILKNKININSCIKFEYWAADHREIKLNLILNSWNDGISDTIFSIKPKLNDAIMQTSLICLDDLIAIDKEDFILSFNVSQNTFEDSSIGFVLRIFNEKLTNVDKNQNSTSFLRDWASSDLISIESEWNTFIPNKDPFTFMQVIGQPKKISFTASTQSKFPSSAILMSKWLSFASELFENLIFKIEADPGMFDYFNITPKICDSMMFCREGVRLDESTESINKYTFSDYKISHNMKLAFFIEYYIPKHIPIHEKETTKDVKFNLELIYFGDPCLKGNPCGNHSTCKSDPEKDMQTNLKDGCDCPSKYIGPECYYENKCEPRDIREKCRAMGTGCSPIEDSYKCICGKENLINWDSIGEKCYAPLVTDLNIWKNPTGNGFELSMDSDQSLIIKFEGIDLSNDVCLDLTYTSPKTVTLRTEYVHENGIKKNLSDFQIMGNDILQFCLNDFIPIKDSVFYLHLSVVAGETGWHSGFILKYNTRIGLIARDEPFLKDWKWGNVKMQDYISLHTPKRHFVSLDKSLKLEVPENTNKRKFWIFSKWIESDTKFSEKTFKFIYEIQKGYESYFDIEAKICYIEELLHFKCVKRPLANFRQDNRTTDLFREFYFSFVNLKNTDLKIKVLLELTTKTEKKFEITFTSLVFEDPCFERNCSNKGKCEYDIHDKHEYKCKCTSSTDAGKDCNKKNACDEVEIDGKKTSGHEICKIQPNINKNVSECHHIDENKFQCDCPSNYYIWNDVLQRCVRNAPKKRSIKCQNTNCHIFKSRDPTYFSKLFHWSHQNFPVVESVDDKMSPFFYSDKSESEMKINVKNMNETSDFCFEFKYYATKGSDLRIKYNDRNIFKLPPTIDSKTSRIDWLPDKHDKNSLEKLCIKSLVLNPEPNFNISFWGKFSGENSVAVYIEGEKAYFIKKSLSSNLSFIAQNDFADNLTAENTFDNQFGIEFPKNSWKREGAYLINFEDSLPKETKTAYIMSNWIEEWVEDMEFKFKISSDHKDFANFPLSLIIFNSSNEEIDRIPISYKNSLTKGDNKEFIEPLKNKLENSFRVAVSIDYKRSDVIGYSSAKTKLFSLGPISLGDPCIESNNLIHRNCNHHGHCIRKGPSNYTCNCDEKFNIGKNCEHENFCNSPQTYYITNEVNKTIAYLKTGKQFCSENENSECISEASGDLKFSCVCKDDKFWNYALNKCSFWPKCVVETCDYLTQKCEEPVFATEKAKCVCKDGFVRSNNTNSDEVKCEKWDICSHGKPPPCGSDPKMRCFSLSDGNPQCQCENGFITVEDKKECLSDLCSYPTLHTCKQICKNTADSFECDCYEGYEMVGSECQLKTGEECTCTNGAFCDKKSNNKCALCKPGYIFLNNTCELDKTDHKFQPYCPKDRITNDNGKPKCNCSEFFEHKNDNQTCKLKEVCGNSSRQAHCDEMSAKCKMDETKIGNYYCECPKGKIFSDFSKTTLGKDDYKGPCISLCDLRGMETACAIKNAKCNPLKLQNSTDITQNQAFKSYCDCLPGFFMNETECLLARYSAKFKLVIKNTNFFSNDLIISHEIPDYYRSPALHNRIKRQTKRDPEYDIDMIGFYEAIQSQNKHNEKIESEAEKSLMKYQLEEFIKEKAFKLLHKKDIIGSKDYSKVGIEKCAILPGTIDFYECELIVVLDKEKHKEKLDKLHEFKSECKDIKELSRNDLCLFPDAQHNLYVNKDKSFSPAMNQPCKSNRFCPKYSNCIADPRNSSYYSCICGTQFNIIKSSYMHTEEHDQFFKKELCEAKNFCDSTYCDLAPQHRVCNVSEPKFNDNTMEYYIDHHCGCIENHHVINKQCTGVCEKNGVCVHGSCETSGYDGSTCVCHDGWSGKTCDKETSIAGVGGWIAGIVILGVLVVIASALALFFAKKARSSGSSSAHPMDDYSGNQSRRFGEQNPTFSRD